MSPLILRGHQRGANVEERVFGFFLLFFIAYEHYQAQCEFFCCSQRQSYTCGSDLAGFYVLAKFTLLSFLGGLLKAA